MSSLKNKYVFKSAMKRLVAYVFDFVGSMLFSFKKKSKKTISPESIDNILVIRVDQIGDIVMTRPAIQALREKYPNAKIDILISRIAKPLFDEEPYVNEVIPFENNWFLKDVSFIKSLKEVYALLKIIKTRKYDLAIDFRGDLRNLILMFVARISNRLGYGRTGGEFLVTHPVNYPTGYHQVRANLRLLNPLQIGEEAPAEKIKYSDVAKKRFYNNEGQVIASISKPLILIHSGAGREEKKWSVNQFKKLIERIEAERVGQVVLVGSEQDRSYFPVDQFELDSVIDLRGKTSLQDLLVLFDCDGVFVGLDSGPGHIAAAQGMPVVSIFVGPNDPDIWHPWTKKLQLIKQDSAAKVDNVFIALQKIMKGDVVVSSKSL